MIIVSYNLIISSLEELSSKDLQYKYWVDGNDDLFSSFTEVISQFYDDSGLCWAIDNNWFIKNHFLSADKKIKEFIKLIDKVTDDQDPVDLIESNEMNEIRSQALELMNYFIEFKQRGIVINNLE